MRTGYFFPSPCQELTSPEIGPRREKICLRCFRPGQSQTGLYTVTEDGLRLRKIAALLTKALISCAVIRK